ncbi:MAG: Hpt domain-containing protein, partial [Trueperaceae bacterium]
MANADLLRRLLATFRLEGEERLESMSAALLALEQQPEDQPRAEIVEGLFREAHSLKGAARAVNLGGIESLCQALEGVLAEIKRGRVELSRALLELLHHTVDTLGGMLEPAVAAETDVDGLVVQLGRASAGSLRSSPAATASAPASGPASGPAPAGTSGAVVPGWPAGATGRAAGGTVRISVAKLEAVMRQVESLLAPRLAAGQLATDIGEARGSLIELKKSRARLQPRLRQIERRLPAVQGELPELPLLLEYLDDEHDRLKVLEERLATLARTAERDVRQLTSLVNGLHEDTKELQLMPCSALLEMFPRLVRELSREQGKEVRLDIEGAEVEVDRRLLEELRDPLTHLLRNAVDHGIENAEVRRERQKPATGRISIVIEQRDSNKIELLLRDDGAGIDMERLRAAVVESGIADADVLVAMEEQALVEFAFHSGVT